MPVLIIVSQAIRAVVSSLNIASTIESEIWSATLSEWSSETDSQVNKLILVINIPYYLHNFYDHNSILIRKISHELKKIILEKIKILTLIFILGNINLWL